MGRACIFATFLALFACAHESSRREPSSQAQSGAASCASEAGRLIKAPAGPLELRYHSMGLSRRADDSEIGGFRQTAEPGLAVFDERMRIHGTLSAARPTTASEAEIARYIRAFEERQLEALYGTYAGRVDERLIALLKQVDAELPADRLVFGAITSENGARIHAGFRVFNGSKDSPSVAEMPYQKIFRARGLQVPSPEELFGPESANLEFKEVGKVFNDGGASARLLALKGLARVAGYDDARLIVHVGTEAHRRLYSAMGFETKHRIWIADRGDYEYLMTAKGSVLKTLAARH
jgi:hypothetical protein